ncbi:hypothetical protein LEP1GSC050_2822 [Leptospira broomii serovar Hurstbridge str. 5399]|uniref:Uncharacterized protein n=1 Tax=Leptospira broomii serovar Hurstbridge str. 5399 TaxID=1049789 RepID=T0FAD6_9LEPT|nr:hypothetical protein [Leptospira broomii]EQA44861.1 hypothetical protein LEP1GSC050_2822 [Leptospira broomii serovar Hurstbridge str. 5399]
MHFYFLANQYIELPKELEIPSGTGKQGTYEIIAGHYDTVKKTNPVFRWRTETISTEDYLDYLQEVKRSTKQYCGLEQWELVNMQCFQERRMKTVFGQIEEYDNGEYVYETFYTAILVYKRRMNKQEFVQYLAEAEESYFSGTDNIDWDSEFDKSDYFG